MNVFDEFEQELDRVSSLTSNEHLKAAHIAYASYTFATDSKKGNFLARANFHATMAIAKKGIAW